MTDLAAKARALREAHVPGDPLILVNVWDAASARTVAAAPGCRAIATASWSIAAAHGVPDGEILSLDDMLAAAARIVAAVDLPVSADLERGYGDVAETVAAALRVGIVGANVEDSMAGGGLRAVEEQVGRLRALRARAEAEGVPFVLNARTDVFLQGLDDLDEALERGRAYLAAGADCVFVPGLSTIGLVRSLVDGLGGPLSVLATPAAPPIGELAAAGVARVSFGPGPLGVATAALGEAAATLLSGGAYPSTLAHRPPVARA